MTICSVCGNTGFSSSKVLLPQLVADWQLSEEEAAYVNEQQGRTCDSCGASLRVVVLGDAIRDAVGTGLTLQAYVRTAQARGLRILDVNGATAISQVLAELPGYCRADFPEIDMQALPYADASFDLVMHSDTLEHVENPQLAIEQCRRVLAGGGRLCFTVPVIVGRMTRSRVGMARSYHGKPAAGKDDFAVHTEFGADAWTLLLRAGFTSVAINHVEYPNATALSAWCGQRAVVPDPASAPAPWSRRERMRTQAVRLRNWGTKIRRRVGLAGKSILSGAMMRPYDQDGLLSIHNHDFMEDAQFQRAYRRGVQAAAKDYRWHWRVHVGLWAARCAAQLPGDFVECGVNRGFMSSAVMELLNWDSTGRTFYLLDTFQGMDERYISEADKAIGVLDRNERDIRVGFYTLDVESVRDNFSEWKNTRIIVGPIPDTLTQIDSQRIAFLHIDLNCSPPEVAAADALWDRLTPGALVLLDDYAFHGFGSQKLAMDEFAKRRGVSVLSLPTGQGLMIKPPG